MAGRTINLLYDVFRKELGLVGRGRKVVCLTPENWTKSYARQVQVVYYRTIFARLLLAKFFVKFGLVDDHSAKLLAHDHPSSNLVLAYQSCLFGKSFEECEHHLRPTKEIVGDIWSYVLSDENLGIRGTNYDTKEVAGVIERVDTLLSILLEETMEVGRQDTKHRLNTGSYYTPTCISEPLSRHAIEHWLVSSLQANGTSSDSSNTSSVSSRKFLVNVRICDPATGSGAFLVSAARYLLATTNLQGREIINPSDLDQLLLRADIVAKNLYGVDVDHSAASITELRLWLWLLEELVLVLDNPNFNAHNFLSKVQINIRVGNALVSPIKITEMGTSTDVVDFLHQKVSKHPKELIRKLKPVVWEELFPMVFTEGGFDIILGNPPWNAVKPYEKEFFSTYDSQMTLHGATKKEVKIVMEKLLQKPEIAEEFTRYQTKIRIESALFDQLYHHQYGELDGRKVGGDRNYYKLFLERSLFLLKPGGVLGLVVPAGFYNSVGSKGLRSLFFDQSTVHWLIGFINRQKIFDIHRSHKFAILVARRSETTHNFQAAFMQDDVAILESPRSVTTEINWGWVKRAVPLSNTLLEVRSLTDYTIVQQMMTYELLKDARDVVGNVVLFREFDMTNDKDLFNTKGQGIPLMEGKHIEQYQPFFSTKIRFWVKEKTGVAKLGASVDYKNIRLGYRAVTGDTNRRTLIASLIPPQHYCGNSIVVVKRYATEGVEKNELVSIQQTLLMCALLNSTAVDYYVRLRVHLNINMFHIYELPVPRPNERLFKKLESNTTRLTEDWNGFEGLRKLYNIEPAPLSSHERKCLVADNDAIVARLYGLKEEQYKHILGSFHHNYQKVEEELRKFEEQALKTFNTYGAGNNERKISRKTLTNGC